MTNIGADLFCGSLGVEEGVERERKMESHETGVLPVALREETGAPLCVSHFHLASSLPQTFSSPVRQCNHFADILDS